MDDFHLVHVETIIDLSHFEIGETITGSVYISKPKTFNEEFELLTVKRKQLAEDVLLDTLSVHPVGDNVSKEVRKIPFMIVPDDRWEVGANEKIIIQTVIKRDHKVLHEVEVEYG